VSAKHAEIIKKIPACGRPQGPLPPLPLSAFDQTPLPRLCGRPLWTAPYRSDIPLLNIGPIRTTTESKASQQHKLSVSFYYYDII